MLISDGPRVLLALYEPVKWHLILAPCSLTLLHLGTAVEGVITAEEVTMTVKSRNATATTAKLAQNTDTPRTASYPWHSTTTATTIATAGIKPVRSGPTTAAGRMTKDQ